MPHHWRPQGHERNCLLSNVNNIQSMIPEDQKNITTQWYSTGDILHHYITLLLMNSFNKTEAAVFSCRLCFLRAFPFISLIISWPNIPHPKYVAWPWIALTTSVVQIDALVRLALSLLVGVSGVTFIITIDEQL